MNGLALCRAYYEELGRPMLEREFPDLLPRLAVGLVGEGSECLGFDDSLSQDHDWGPGFCLWLGAGDYEWEGPRLREAYRRLPGAFGGFGPRRDSPEGAGRVGVQCTERFYTRYLGVPHPPETLAGWRRIPEHFLACAVSGEVFYDGLGTFSDLRRRLLAFYPEDCRLQMLASRAATMAQAGQYNYPRCIRRGETIASDLALAEFTRAGISMAHLLNRRYTPFYKWMHRSLRELPLLGDTAPLFASLFAPEPAAQREETIEEICRRLLAELVRQGLADPGDNFLLAHCGELTARIADPALRGLPMMEDLR